MLTYFANVKMVGEENHDNNKFKQKYLLLYFI